MTYHFENRNFIEYKKVTKEITFHITCIYEFLTINKDIGEINHWFKESKLYDNENFCRRRAGIQKQIDVIRQDLATLSESAGELGNRIIECKNILRLEASKDEEFRKQYNKYHKINGKKHE
jgi:uncharacterized coiled-coil DUF342 family protein